MWDVGWDRRFFYSFGGYSAFLGWRLFLTLFSYYYCTIFQLCCDFTIWHDTSGTHSSTVKRFYKAVASALDKVKISNERFHLPSKVIHCIYAGFVVSKPSQQESCHQARCTSRRKWFNALAHRAWQALSSTKSMVQLHHSSTHAHIEDESIVTASPCRRCGSRLIFMGNQRRTNAAEGAASLVTLLTPGSAWSCC